MTSTPPPERLAVLFVHGVGIREPDYAESAIRGLRREFAKATGGHEGDNELIVESVYWAPAVMEREDRLLRAAFPERAGIWFSGMNWLTHRISNGSNLALLPLALSGLVRHVPGVPKIHWPTLGGQQLRRRHRPLPGHPAHPRGVRRGASTSTRRCAGWPCAHRTRRCASSRTAWAASSPPIISTTCTRAGPRTRPPPHWNAARR